MSKRILLLFGLGVTALATLAQATTLPRLTFEELTDTSDSIITGTVMRSWAAWDAGHHYIWTHYEVAVTGIQKGAKATTVELSEPGGVAEGMGMSIAGSVSYKVGDSVMVFMQRMLNGMVRTTGWGQGKYTVDSRGRLHAEAALKGVEYVDSKTGAVGVEPLAALDGLTLQEAGLRVAARIRATANKGKVQ